MHRMIRKYSPCRLSEFSGREEQLNEFRASVKKGGGIILHGTTGSGKTSAVYALANELDYEVLELGASDARDKATLLSTIGAASRQMSLFNKGKFILIDDVDSLSSRDRGAVTAISSLLKESSWPVIMTAEDVMHDKIKELRKKCRLIGLGKPHHDDVFSILKKICDEEGISYDEAALRSLARQSGGDIRAAMTDLQVLALGGDVDPNLLYPRQQKEHVKNALLLVFKSMKAENVLGAFDSTDIDFDKRLLWLDENLPSEYSGESLSRAYDCMSRSDVFQGRIRRSQHWRYLVYINALTTAGIALAKDRKNSSVIEYKQSKRPLKYWLANMKNARRKALAEKIAPFFHVSKRKAFKDVVPFLSHLFRHGDAFSVASELGLNEEEVNWLEK